MSEYRPVLDELRERRKGKPGELILMTGVVLTVAAPFALLLANQHGEKLAALKADGMVAEAIVKSKSVRSESYTDSKGRQKSRDIHAIDLQYDLNAQLPYARWKASKPFVKPKFPALTTISIDVGESYYDELTPGQKTSFVRTPYDYKGMMLTDQVEYETSFAYKMWWYLATAAATVAGMIITMIGWRKRFPRA